MGKHREEAIIKYELLRKRKAKKAREKEMDAEIAHIDRVFYCKKLGATMHSGHGVRYGKKVSY